MLHHGTLKSIITATDYLYDLYIIQISINIGDQVVMYNFEHSYKN